MRKGPVTESVHEDLRTHLATKSRIARTDSLAVGHTLELRVEEVVTNACIIGAGHAAGASVTDFASLAFGTVGARRLAIPRHAHLVTTVDVCAARPASAFIADIAGALRAGGAFRRYRFAHPVDILCAGRAAKNAETCLADEVRRTRCVDVTLRRVVIEDASAQEA